MDIPVHLNILSIPLLAAGLYLLFTNKVTSSKVADHIGKGYSKPILSGFLKSHNILRSIGFYRFWVIGAGVFLVLNAWAWSFGPIRIGAALCDRDYQQSKVRSEHIGIDEAFWNESTKTCFLIIRRPYFGGSDWAINYIRENNLNDWDIIEAEEYRLVNTKDNSMVLNQIYSYKSQQEYLDNPNKRSEWKEDFLKQVAPYRY